MASTSKEIYGRQSGSVFVVGNGEVFGELGLGSQVQDITYPIAIPDLIYGSIIQVASSALHSLALTKQGQIYSWGCDEFGALGRVGAGEFPLIINHPSIRYIKFKKIACGSSTSMAISTSGVLYTWGTFRSNQGLCGYLPHIDIQNHPRIIDDVANVNFVDICAGESHCLALDDNGHVYSWVADEYAILGRPPTTPSLIPTKLDLKNIVSIACGSVHSLVVDRFRQVYSWGLNHMQQCGLAEKINEEKYIKAPDSIAVPTLLPYFRKRMAGDKQRLLEEADKTLPSHDQQGSTSMVRNSRKEQEENVELVTKRHNVLSVAAGQYHSVALLDDNSLRLWGRCDGGQLGIMFYNTFEYPASCKVAGKKNEVYAIGYPVSNLWQCSEEIKKIVCGSNHTMILSASGKIWGFGQSTFYQLGHYFQQDIVLPSPIESIMSRGRVIDASGGDRYSFFVVVEDEETNQGMFTD